MRPRFMRSGSMRLGSMRSRVIVVALSFYLALALGCTSKPSTGDNASGGGTGADAKGGSDTAGNGAKDVAKQPVIVASGTTVTVSLGSALGSKLSQAGQTFTGSVAKDVSVENTVVVAKGSAVSGTVTDAKPLGKFAGGAVLQLRLDSINVNGVDTPVQVALRTFSAKGKGKRTAVMSGGGAALGGIIGGLAGGGKGAAIGLLAGGGAGAGGAALTANKDVVLPAESAVSFQLTQAVEIK
jgi:hypothetical protein